MNTLLAYLWRHHGINQLTAGLLVASLILYALAWWLRQTTITFNSTVLLIGGGVLVTNTALVVLFARREPFLGYIFGGVSLLVQLFLLILLWMATRGLFA